MSAAKFFDSMIQQAPRYPGDFVSASSKEAVMTRVPASSSQNSQFSAIPPSVRRVMRSRLAEWRLKIPSRLSEFIASSILDLVIPRGQTSQQRHNHGYNNINSNWPSQENWPLEKYIGIKKKEKNCEFCEKNRRNIILFPPGSWQFPKYSGSDNFSLLSDTCVSSNNSPVTSETTAATAAANSNKMYPYVSVGSHGSQQSPFGTTSSRSGSSRKTRSFLHFPRLFISHQDLYLAPPLTPLSQPQIIHFIGSGEYYYLPRPHHLRREVCYVPL